MKAQVQWPRLRLHLPAGFALLSGMAHIFPSGSGLARAFGLLFSMLLSTPASALELGLPAQCAIGKDCFVQQYPDMDAGPALPIRSAAPPPMTAMTVPISGCCRWPTWRAASLFVAVADGTVLRMRDGEPDHLVTSEADRAVVADKECGNGMIVDLGSGFEVQYCHLREGSLAVKPGDPVKRGQKLGEIGASGLAQFPHVHLTVRRDGKAVDPATGRDLSAGCLKSGETAQPLFAPEIVAELAKGESQTIALGVAGGPVDYAALSVSGPRRKRPLPRRPSWAGAGSSISTRAIASWCNCPGRTGNRSPSTAVIRWTGRRRAIPPSRERKARRSRASTRYRSRSSGTVRCFSNATGPIPSNSGF